VKGKHTKEQQALIERINSLKLSDSEKKELKRLLLILIRQGEK